MQFLFVSEVIEHQIQFWERVYNIGISGAKLLISGVHGNCGRYPPTRASFMDRKIQLPNTTPQNTNADVQESEIWIMLFFFFFFFFFKAIVTTVLTWVAVTFIHM